MTSIGDTMVNRIDLILALEVSSLVRKTVIEQGYTDLKGNPKA